MGSRPWAGSESSKCLTWSVNCNHWPRKTPFRNIQIFIHLVGYCHNHNIIYYDSIHHRIEDENWTSSLTKFHVHISYQLKKDKGGQKDVVFGDSTTHQKRMDLIVVFYSFVHNAVMLIKTRALKCIQNVNVHFCEINGELFMHIIICVQKIYFELGCSIRCHVLAIVITLFSCICKSLYWLSTSHIVPIIYYCFENRKNNAVVNVISTQ